MTTAHASTWIADPAGLAARGTLDHLEHGLILSAVQAFESIVRAFLYMLLELVAPDLMTRAFAQRPPAKTEPRPAQPHYRFLLDPPPRPRLDRIAGLLGETLEPEHWRVSFQFFRSGRSNALEALSKTYTLRLPEDPHEKLRVTLEEAAAAITRCEMPALPLARRIEAARRVLADPRGVLARIIQRLHKEPGLMMRLAPRIADPANDATAMPSGLTTKQMLSLAQPLVESQAPEIAALFPALPDPPDSS